MASGPDQGFAWVIALSCFFINFIMAGLARTAGVLYVAIINLYGVSREAATTPFSIRVSVRNMTGPVIGLLGQKYGIRLVTTIGGGVAALGSILCYFAPNVLCITIFWGFIHGLGFGLSTVIHMIAINQYFDKYKASALGLGYSGDCFGSFAFPIIIEYLFANYDIRGSFLIIGGMVLNVVPMALLLRKPPWIKELKKIKKPKKNSRRKKVDSTRIKDHTNSLCLERSKILKTHVHSACLSTVNENEGQPEDYETDERTDNSKHFVTFGYDSKGHYNKAFVSSETNLSSPSERKEIEKVGKPACPGITLKHGKPITSSPLIHRLNTGSSHTLRSLDESSRNFGSNDNNKHFKTPDEYRVCSAMRTSQSASELTRRNESFHSINRCIMICKSNSEERRDSLPPVFGKGKSLLDKNEKYESCENMKNDGTHDNESCPPVSSSSNMKKRSSSFIGQVAQDIANRMRTASFASQVASDGFVATIGQDESETESEPEMECQLKSIVEHKNHDLENCCTNHDLVLSIDKSMMNECLKEMPQQVETIIAEEKDQSPSLLKLMWRTNTRPMFILISISMAVYAFLFVSVITIIIDYASDLGIPEDKGKYLIIGFSVADLFGRLGFGQVIDRNLMKMKNYSGATMLLMGVLVAAIPLNTSFNYMMVCMCMYGIFQGGTAIMFPILINVYMDRNSESVAMGCLNFYGGILMLLMAPMIGYFRDNMGSYNYVFYIIGGVVAVVGILWQFEPMIIKFEKRKQQEKYFMQQMDMIRMQQQCEEIASNI